MTLFQSLGGLLDQLISWLGRAAVAFLESLILALQQVWESSVLLALRAAFGFVTVLYVIFYAGLIAGETLMEIWDPKYVDSKPAQKFKIVGLADQDSPLPKKTAKTERLILNI